MNKNIVTESQKFRQQIDFGKLAPYIEDDDITDIGCNSNIIWIDHVSKGVQDLDFNMDSQELEKLAYQISNYEGKQFNKKEPAFSADYGDLRIQVQHESISPSGINMFIRKTPYLSRILEEFIEQNKYCKKIVFELFKKAVEVKMGIVSCGETGAGKTELTKKICEYIPQSQTIVTIEDTSELHLHVLYPKKKVVELKINEFYSFDEANRSALRMNPSWILLSEARGKEIAKLMSARSSGHGICTTLHMKNAIGLVERIVNMYSQEDRPSDTQLENMVHDYFDIVVHIDCVKSNNKTHRFIDQICIYERNNGVNNSQVVYESDQDFNVKMFELPEQFAKNIRNNDFVERWNSHVQKENYN